LLSGSKFGFASKLTFRFFAHCHWIRTPLKKKNILKIKKKSFVPGQY
jgi:hypothetical protein